MEEVLIFQKWLELDYYVGSLFHMASLFCWRCSVRDEVVLLFLLPTPFSLLQSFRHMCGDITQRSNSVCLQ